jgi:Zn-dependent M28 family amino/carboxypeptidase
MAEIGLEPPFDGSYLQEVPLVEMNSSISHEIIIEHKSGNFSLKPSIDFTAWSSYLNSEVTLTNSQLIFVGYGINSSEWQWNDFKNVDVRGKTIVVLVNDPGFHANDSTLFNGRSMTYYGRWRYKYEEAERQGAAGCIIVHEDEAAGYPWEVVNGRPNRSDFFLDDEKLVDPACKVYGWITRDAAVKFFAMCGLDYEEQKLKAAEKDFKAFDLNAHYSITIKNRWNKSISKNVAGFIKGKTKPDEVIVYCAHWDHLGIGKKVNGDSIYNGASDNAAAIAWMLSIAKTFKSVEQDLDRSILFISPTAEESGMLGSEFYVNNPVFPMEKTIACFNNDVVLFLGSFKDVTITGMGHSELDEYLDTIARKFDRYICNDPNPENGMFYRSDHLPFLKAGVPSLFAKGYSHQVELGRERTLQLVDEYWQSTYHKPADHYIPGVHKLAGLVDDSKLFFRLGYTLATGNHYPKWKPKSEFYVKRF